ncbi:AAA family ATPase [Ruegeria arenilitoris]|uniref:AAA family ATPase n=1 Tax=Ruegeria arenilitoris TaxID=1173585 RepID=UPI00147E3FB6|nr:adenylate/guanylate cyclase domain-containing protein [Ruegeria arenilitoris]
MSHNVGEWLEQLGLGEYSESFAKNRIKFEHLPYLGEDDLIELGVEAMGDRKSLSRAIAALDEKRAEPSETTSLGIRSTSMRTADAERRQLTVMFCDLVDSTALSQQLDPEDLHEVMRRYQDTVAGLVARFEGHVAKFLGDGVLAFFGWPRAYEDQAERAVRAGMAVTKAVQSLKSVSEQSLTARVGVATGKVVIGDIVGETTTEKDAVVGETPNLAARVLNVALPGQVVTDAFTHKLIGGALDFEALGAQRLKGFEKPVATWRVVGEPAAETRFKSAHSGTLSPFVGRKHELDLLNRAWQLSREGTSQVVLISGEPGIGKSRLLEAMREEFGETDYARITISCSPHHTTSPFYPLIVHLEHVLRFAREDGANGKLAKLEGALRGLNLPLIEVIPLLASLLSIPLPDDRYPPTRLAPQQQKLQTMKAIVVWLLDEASKRPVILAWEDLHWADPSTLELLAFQLEKSTNAPILNILTFRPEFKPHWPSRRCMRPIVLDRLKRTEVENLINLQTGGDQLPQEMVEHIVGKTDGVPLFVEELTKAMLEASFVQKRNGRLELKGQLSDTAVPATLQDSLMARLDQSPKLRMIAQFGAVLGREFDYEMLLAVSSIEDEELQLGLARLVAAGLLQQRGKPPHAKYEFKHALVRDTAYASLLKAKRRRLHALSAEVIETMRPEIAGKRPETLAYHLLEAGKHDASIKFWIKAGEKAIARSSNVEAIAHFNIGLKLVPAIDHPTRKMEVELELQSKLAVPLTFSKGWTAPEVRRAYQRARKLCDRLGRTEDLFPILRGYWNYRLSRGEHRHALNLAEKLGSLAKQEGNAQRRALGHRVLGTSLFFVGQSKEAAKHLQAGIEIDDTLCERQRREEVAIHGDSAGVICRLYSAWNLWLSGFPDSAVHMAEEGLSFSQDLSVSHCVGWALSFKAVILNHRREFAASLSASEAAVTHAREHGLAAWLAFGGMCRGRALCGLGEYEEGLDQLRTGLKKWHETGAGLGDTQWLAFLSASCIDACHFDSAWVAMEEAEAIKSSNQERFFLAELERLKGILHLESGDTASAELQFQKAIDRAHAQHAKSLELRAATSLALLWRDQNCESRARSLLTPICSWFSEGFETPDFLDANALLKQ